MPVVQSRSVRTTVALVVAFALVAGCTNDSPSGSGSTTGPNGETTAPDPNEGFNQPQFAGEPQIGGSIKFGIESNIATLDPAGNLAQPSDIVTALAIYDQMVSYGEGGTLEGDLATEWSNSEDLKTWTFTLREGVEFSDGTPFDADAVVAHFNRLKDPATNCTCAPNAAEIAEITAVDPTTVEFQLVNANAFFADMLAGVMGMIASPTATEKFGADYPRNPVGTGPFILTDFESLLLKKNPNYWRKDDQGRQLPYLDEIDLQPIPEAKVRLQTLQSGGIDILQTADTGTVVDAVANPDYVTQKVTGSSATITIFNMRKPPFNDKRLRQAVAYGFQRDRLNRVVYRGARQEAFSPFAADSPYYADIDWIKDDREKAKQLVEEVKADGVSVEYTTSCIATAEARAGLAVTKEGAEELGMKPTNEFLDQGAYVNKVIGADHDYTIGCFRSPQIASADGLYTVLKTGGSGNVMGYSNPDVDTWLEEIRQTTDTDEHIRLLRLIQEQINEDVPALPTLYDLFANVRLKEISGLPAPEANYLGAIKVTTLYRIAE